MTLARMKTATSRVLVLGFAATLVPLAASAQAPPTALVISDVGEHEQLVTDLEAFGWQVTTSAIVDLDGYGDLVDYDAVWIPADSAQLGLRFVAQEGGDAERYALGGGIVVIWQLSPDAQWVDIAPGGIDAAPLDGGQAPPLTISAADHPLITGDGIGGVALTATDLDAANTGGAGSLFNLPEDGAPVIIAENAEGPVLVEYEHGSGRVILSALASDQEACRRNLALYLESLVGSS